MDISQFKAVQYETIEFALSGKDGKEIPILGCEEAEIEIDGKIYNYVRLIIPENAKQLPFTPKIIQSNLDYIATPQTLPPSPQIKAPETP
jgi:hypothetical protein